MENFSDWLAPWLERVFGPHVHSSVYGSLTWADVGVASGIIVGILLLQVAAAGFLRRQRLRDGQAREPKTWFSALLNAVGKPAYVLIWLYGVYLGVLPIISKLVSEQTRPFVRDVSGELLRVGLFALVFWLFFRLTPVLELLLAAWASKTRSRLDDVILPLVGRSLRVLVPVIGIILALPLIGLPQEYAGVLAKISSILVILAVAWVCFQAVYVGEKAVVARYDIKAADNLQARKIYTQVHVLSRTIYALIAIFTVASVLMLFEEVRRFGTSLLASAGVVGIIVGFAAQRTIANLFAGFQLAMTQPIRLDDVVIVEGEYGNIEEITLTYVVIKLWDERRMIVPLSQFIEKPFQNWTRASARLIGSVTLWVDYAVPIDELRKATKQIVESSPLWDKRFWNLQVADTSERSMQIRILVTASDSGKAWDLRCEVREKLISYIQRTLQQHWPRVRAEVDLHSSSLVTPSQQAETSLRDSEKHLTSRGDGTA